MKTLLLNPPSFDDFDAAGSSRFQATREIKSHWYPVWLAYPAGLIPDSRLLDATTQGISAEETIRIAGDYEFIALCTSTPGFENDVRLAEAIKSANPDIKIGFVGAHVTVQPEDSLNASEAIDFVTRKEYDYALAEFAEGRKLDDIDGISYRKDGKVVHNANRPDIQDLDALPFVTSVYHRDLNYKQYDIPYLLYPYVSFYSTRGCPARCTFCLWPQTMSGHVWRTRSVENVVAEVRQTLELFPDINEIFFDDDTFPFEKSRTLALCEAFKPLKFTWSCNSRVHVDYETLKAMKESGCRLLDVGFETGDATVLRNMKKGATLDKAREFMKNCKKLGLVVHGDFQIGLPGETPETIEKTIQFAMELDPDTIQVSITHPYPGTAFYNYVTENGFLTEDDMTDEMGHQLPNIQYPGLDRRHMVRMVEEFYDRYYFRPKVVYRIMKRSLTSAQELRRRYREGKEFLHLRAERRRFAQS
jgi:hopanoid biosynthesis associated radical SAM protein HpnJ